MNSVLVFLKNFGEHQPLTKFGVPVRFGLEVREGEHFCPAPVQNAVGQIVLVK